MFIALLLFVNAGTQVTSIVIITRTCIYLRYKIIQSNQFFKSVKRDTVEKQNVVNMGRLMEILQEQVKPTVSVFIAQGIDAVFNGFAMVIMILVGMVGSDFAIQSSMLLALNLCQYCSHAVVYALRDKYIRKEFMNTYEKIMGPRKSKVIMLNGQ